MVRLSFFITSVLVGCCMTDWILGTVDILLGTYIAVLGNVAGLRIPLFRRVGLGLIIIGLFLLSLTLINEAAIPGSHQANRVLKHTDLTPASAAMHYVSERYERRS